MDRTRRLLSFVVALLISVTAAASAELAGVTLPDETQVGDLRLVLNGLGLREATFLKVDVYVAGLYVEERSSDPAPILDPARAKRLVMRFVRDVGREKLVDAWNEGFEKNAAGKLEALRRSIDTLNGWMIDVRDGDTITLTWIPGSGTEVEVPGRPAGSIEGDAFGRALLSIWLGDSPPNEGLKEGLLGRP